MGGSTDDTGSVASFEDVGDQTKGLVSVTPGPKTAEKKSPDIQYVLQYSSRGKVFKSCKSSKPFESANDDPRDVLEAKKPIIEIVSTVESVRRTWHPPPPGVVSSDSDSDYEPSAKHKTSKMLIHSAILKNSLRAVVGYYPGVDFMADRVSIPAPYAVLIHHREALTRFKLAQPTCHSPAQVIETARQIDILLGFLDDNSGPRIREELQRHRRDVPCATFAWAWLLFKPGEIVYSKKNNQWAPYVVARVDYEGDEDADRDERGELTLECWNLGFSCGRITRKTHSFYIDGFAGEQAVSSLELVPAALFSTALPAEVPEAETMEEKEIRLGKLYWDLVQGPSFKEYDGKLVDASGPRGNFVGRVVVDAEGFRRFCNKGPAVLHYNEMPNGPPPGMRPHQPQIYQGQHPGQPTPRRGVPPRQQMRPGGPGGPYDPLPSFKPRCGCAECDKLAAPSIKQPSRFVGFEDLDPTHDEPPKTNLYFLALEKSLPAFVLAERRWAFVRVEHLKDVKPDREAFKHLVLDEEVKHTVKTLIGKFASDGGTLSPWPRDLIKNKGEGRVFLLHGSPGVGKTATCEAAAELAQRPLLCLTSGDIGSAMVDRVEQYLSHFLHLGERYGALVLLDEADIYLERRRMSDLYRNGLVSVFLRALEYYKGVLFLTTNRVAAFDSAFTSRIHVALHYRRLNDADRARVWGNSFDRLERDAAGRVHVSLAAREFARGASEILTLKLNGRQIKNALQVAVALAESDAADDNGDLGSDDGSARAVSRVVVSDRHLRAVIKMNRGFKDFTRARKVANESDDEDDDDMSVEAAAYSSEHD